MRFLWVKRPELRDHASQMVIFWGQRFALGGSPAGVFYAVAKASQTSLPSAPQSMVVSPGLQPSSLCLKGRWEIACSCQDVCKMPVGRWKARCCSSLNETQELPNHGHLWLKKPGSTKFGPHFPHSKWVKWSNFGVSSYVWTWQFAKCRHFVKLR